MTGVQNLSMNKDQGWGSFNNSKRSDRVRHHVKLHETAELLNVLYVCGKPSKNIQDIIAPFPGPSHYFFIYTSFGTSMSSLSSFLSYATFNAPLFIYPILM